MLSGCRPFSSQSTYFNLLPHRATGVTTAVVESMEDNFKKDVLREAHNGGGRILLHDEVEERPGVVSIVPIWEVVEEKDIMTPRDVFDLIVAQGYRVCFSSLLVLAYTGPNVTQINYGRVAIVSLWFIFSQNARSHNFLD